MSGLEPLITSLPVQIVAKQGRGLPIKPSPPFITETLVLHTYWTVSLRSIFPSSFCILSTKKSANYLSDTSWSSSKKFVSFRARKHRNGFFFLILNENKLQLGSRRLFMRGKNTKNYDFDYFDFPPCWMNERNNLYTQIVKLSRHPWHETETWNGHVALYAR